MLFRLFGLLVSLAASRRQVQIQVDAIGFFIVRGVTVIFAQVTHFHGPISGTHALMRACVNVILLM